MVKNEGRKDHSTKMTLIVLLLLLLLLLLLSSSSSQACVRGVMDRLRHTPMLKKQQKLGMLSHFLSMYFRYSSVVSFKTI
jgi:hypothetical protein